MRNRAVCASAIKRFVPGPLTLTQMCHASRLTKLVLRGAMEFSSWATSSEAQQRIDRGCESNHSVRATYKQHESIDHEPRPALSHHLEAKAGYRTLPDPPPVLHNEDIPPTTSPSLELTYFNTGGRAEPIRLILAYGGISFEDVRIPGKDFPAKKPSLDLPFGQVPTLHVDGKVYAQSIAIARYVAMLAGLYPENPLDALEADLAVDALVEATTAFVTAAFMEPDEAKRIEKLADVNNIVLPRLLGGLEKRVVGPFFLGTTPSFADIYVLDFHMQIWTAFPNLLKMAPDHYPNLAAIADRLSNSIELAAYFKPK